MKEKFKQLKQQFLNEIEKLADIKSARDFEIRYLGRNGALAKLFEEMKTLPNELRPEIGKLANEVKIFLHEEYEKHKTIFEKEKKDESFFDYTLPGVQRPMGHLHPMTQMIFEVSDFFSSMGFMVLDGPEVETDYYNFEAVNIPKDHPARDMQDTFYTTDDNVLRTQTSSVQVRAMRQYGAPLKMIAPGRVFRNEATDVRHEHTFYQIEGMMIDTNISFARMKGVLEVFAKYLYGDDTKVRLRPKFYPFVEPGVNGEVTCLFCKGTGCRLCKQTGWLEIFGAGLIHPNVLREGNIDSKKYSGFAFGFGLNRLAMLKYGIEDVRLFQSGDMRFLEQF